MAYEIELSPRAEQRLRDLYPLLRGVVLDHLYELAESPTRVSRPSAIPAEPPGYQAFDFDYILHNELHRFVILFKYAADERTLWVYAIGHINHGSAY